MIDFNIYNAMRLAIRGFLERMDISKFEIADEDLKDVYLLGCDVIDNHSFKVWRLHQRVFCKKALLLLCSKLSENAYLEPTKKAIYLLKKSDICKDYKFKEGEV